VNLLRLILKKKQVYEFKFKIQIKNFRCVNYLISVKENVNVICEWNVCTNKSVRKENIKHTKTYHGLPLIWATSNPDILEFVRYNIEILPILDYNTFLIKAKIKTFKLVGMLIWSINGDPRGMLCLETWKREFFSAWMEKNAPTPSPPSQRRFGDEILSLALRWLRPQTIYENNLYTCIFKFYILIECLHKFIFMWCLSFSQDSQ
jgi:hypothetical protein